MLRYVVKRVLQFIPVFLGVTLIMFAMQNIVPGDPVKLIAGERTLDPQTEMNLRARYHLIKTDGEGRPVLDENGDSIPTPLWERYALYLGNLAHGDLGRSYQRGEDVSNILAQKYPYTAQLAVVAIVIETILGVSAGIISAVKRYSFWDVFVTLVTSVLVAMPAFWLGMLLQLLFGVWLPQVTGGAIALPPSGALSPMSQFPGWMYFIMPSITLASISTAYTARIMRSQLLDVLNQDFIRTARAKGLSRHSVIVHHALKNALIPVVTYIGMDFGTMMAGAILTETVFNWPGVGYEIFRAIGQRDYPIVMGSVTMIVIVVMIINLIVDISYAFLDPRIRLGGTNQEQ
ncbi:binding-protein-dependent transport systems inner membrane component [Coriobacterium glomerans PW2]|uniref:Binding-protein-dependent transport systems inner membrane component n=1 Tax=Coriobacterium glomerans (strain ATCC 49209 / DSM 20642 / JCM 10262 / PW2) TaxID=700015 RepID=F2N8G7_CORGP|nr:ABC transporter permease [Coriobacterium glomerans]AEB07350.1 binding-protein-dependent transport systems inner membrane component [Coriobacterium glomerans PW2]